MVFLLLLLVSSVACNGDSNGSNDGDEKITSEADGMKTADTPDEDVVITIGSLSDITGPASNAMTVINMALDDVVEYFNDENLIPGVELKVVTYDGQLDPARDIPGYEWLLLLRQLNSISW